MLDGQEDLEQFGVFCHGKQFAESLLFKYAEDSDELEPCDAIFQNLGSCYYGSCVSDLLIFIFSCINQDIRRNFLLEFIGKVYFESFKRAVSSINKNIAMFEKIEFCKQVQMLAVHCGIAALELALEHNKHERRQGLHDQENVLATFRDVVKLTGENSW